MAKPRPVTGIDPSRRVRPNARRILATRIDEVYQYDGLVANPANITDLHDMRIAFKRLRYLLEIFGSAFAADENPMDTVSLASFVALTKTPAPIPTELQTDAQTATACMVAIQYQLDALSGLAAKWGVQALCGAMGEDKSPLAMSVLTSLGPDWKSGVDAKAEALQAAQTAEQPAEVKP